MWLHNRKEADHLIAQLLVYVDIFVFLSMGYV